jgi:hypothetical protein
VEGKGAESKLARGVDRLQREVESHQQVIGELTVANRIRPVPLSQEVRALITPAHQNPPPQIRLKALLRALGIAASSWYRQATPEPKPPGSQPKPLDPVKVQTVVSFAQQYPWWGYRRLAIVLRRADHAFSKRFVRAVFRAHGLFQQY